MEYAAPPPAHRGRILLAEDEPHIRRILQTVLEEAGFAVDAVGEGTVARERMIGNQSYVLVLTDIMMPGCSGLDLLAALRTLPHRRTIPVIVLTAKGQDADREAAFSLGADDFLTKPFSPKKLLSRIEQLLHVA
jgi:DNA-binding response OmpR family regulator